MESAVLFGVLRESFFLIAVFGLFFIIAILRGTQTIINAILALYLALLIALEFPFFDVFLTGTSKQTDAIVMVILFSAFALAAFFVFKRLMPTEYREQPMRNLGKKLLLSSLATVLVMAYSYNALPVTDIITPGSPVKDLFAPENRFFFWLIVPIIGLFFV